MKINWNDFCKEFCKELWKKNNTWNIRHLVDESFVPANQRIILKIVGFLVFSYHVSIIQKQNFECIWPRYPFAFLNGVMDLVNLLLQLGFLTSIKHEYTIFWREIFSREVFSREIFLRELFLREIFSREIFSREIYSNFKITNYKN